MSKNNSLKGLKTSQALGQKTRSLRMSQIFTIFVTKNELWHIVKNIYMRRSTKKYNNSRANIYFVLTFKKYNYET